MFELPAWVHEVEARFAGAPADPEAVRTVVARLAARWELEFVPDVQDVIEASMGALASQALRSVVHIVIWHALFGAGQVEAATEGTRRCAEIEAKAFDLLEELGTLMREHARLGWEGAEQSNPPDFGEVFDSLVRKEPHWACATGVKETLSAIASTSQSAPTFIDVIESATALWKHDYSAYWPERGDHRTAVAHKMLDELNRFKCLTHRANATLINIASDTSDHTQESLKALIARRRKAGG